MKDIMQYVSIGYLFCFMPLLMLVYSLLPGRQRWKVLLAASYVFYILMSGRLLIFPARHQRCCFILRDCVWKNTYPYEGRRQDRQKATFYACSAALLCRGPVSYEISGFYRQGHQPAACAYRDGCERAVPEAGDAAGESHFSRFRRSLICRICHRVR
jgi:hypothetical protein